jgi:adenosine deaminase
MSFIKKFHWMRAVLVDVTACRRVAYENVEDARLEGLDYAELRFSPSFMAEPHGLDPADVVAAVADGIVLGARRLGIKVKLIGILTRSYGPEAAWQELEALLAHKEKLVGIDLAGDEANQPGELFVDHLRRAKEAGLRITVHAGESAGPESVWQAVQELGAERLGHAVCAAQDPELMTFLAQEQIGIESCLTSNVQTSTVADYASHPLEQFLQKGLLATINTDDPGISGIDLEHELEVAAPAAGLTPGQIRQARENAVRVAFLSEPERKALLAKKAL